MQHKIGVIPFSIDGDGMVIMFVTSQNGGQWILPKGNLETRESHKQGCKREAFEEAGVKGKILENFPITALITKTTASAVKETAVTYYPMLVTKELDKWPEKSKRQRRWAPLKQAHRMTDRQDFRRLIKQFTAFEPWLLASVKQKPLPPKQRRPR